MVSWAVLIDMSSARAVAGSAGIMTCIPSVPQAVMATRRGNGALTRRLLSSGVVNNRMVCPDVRLQHACMGCQRQHRHRPPVAGGHMRALLKRQRISIRNNGEFLRR